MESMQARRGYGVISYSQGRLFSGIRVKGGTEKFLRYCPAADTSFILSSFSWDDKVSSYRQTHISVKCSNFLEYRIIGFISIGVTGHSSSDQRGELSTPRLLPFFLGSRHSGSQGHAPLMRPLLAITSFCLLWTLNQVMLLSLPNCILLITFCFTWFLSVWNWIIAVSNNRDMTLSSLEISLLKKLAFYLKIQPHSKF